MSSRFSEYLFQSSTKLLSSLLEVQKHEKLKNLVNKHWLQGSCLDLWNQGDDRLRSKEKELIMMQVWVVNVSNAEHRHDHIKEVVVDWVSDFQESRDLTLNEQKVLGNMELLHLLDMPCTFNLFG